MCAERPAADLRVIFREILNRAITQGRRMPIHGTGLGPDTWAAIDMVAREHPYATADLAAVRSGRPRPGPRRATGQPVLASCVSPHATAVTVFAILCNGSRPITVIGPLLEDEAAQFHEGYWH